MRRAGGVGLGLLLGVAGMAGCASMGGREQAPMAATGAPSLYQRLGGRDGIALVVDDFAGFLVADDRVNGRFKPLKPADVARLKSNLSDQVCEASGGPCAYLGRDMKTTHRGLGIAEAEWDATVEDLVKALDKRKVGEPEKAELIRLLAPMKPDIVGQ
ncbi:MAG: group 1 truncated hemoglobin [Candidatus Rokubacteria bacterium]|nr:group 1 truncated hemoglobin [Candidatus Rokubacteria bacterium]